MKKVFVGLCFVWGIIMLSGELFSSSFAYTYEIDESILFYKDDFDMLERDIEVFLNYVDDYLLPNSSFLYADELRDNYDFLVNFALDYIIENAESFDADIKENEKCVYLNAMGIEKDTFSYVDVNVIYDITDRYFGVRDFNIINDNICEIDGYISLSDYADKEFLSTIVDVSVTRSDSNVMAEVLYDSGDKYLYVFYIDNSVLKLKNIEVL